MPDRVREALFSMLGSRYGTDGGLPPVRVADVFAGSGSMGLEALSRGAAVCHFFEREPAALATLRANLSALGVGPQGVIRAGDAWVAPFGLGAGLGDWPPAGLGDRPPAGLAAPLPGFDLVFLDPPYADARDAGPGGRVACFLARWAASAGPENLVVLHHESDIAYDDDPQRRWTIVKRRRFGSHAVTFFQPRSPAPVE